MPLRPFSQYFPKLAADELRSIWIVPDTIAETASVAEVKSLADEAYALHEYYCDEPDCDCRRVVLCVEGMHSGVQCWINFGFERNHSLAGPFIDPMLPTGPDAKHVLKLVKDETLTDQQYVDRLKRHYRLFKEQVEVQSCHSESPRRKIWFIPEPSPRAPVAGRNQLRRKRKAERNRKKRNRAR